ncbi:MAG: methylglyoxal synthase [Planctomycetota bacterium]
MIALIAHDEKKPVLLEFCREHAAFLRQHRLVATGHTGSLLEQQLELPLEKLVHGPEGGDLIIGGRVAQGQVHAIIFFRDPLTAQPHEPDVSALLRVCDVHNVPLATNPATGAAVIAWLARGDAQVENR